MEREIRRDAVDGAFEADNILYKGEQRVCPRMSECVKVCQSVAEYVRVWQSVCTRFRFGHSRTHLLLHRVIEESKWL
jgi:hypothetical protein